MIAAKRMTAIAAGCGMLLLMACQDGEAKRRAEAQKIIASATMEIQSFSAVLNDPDQADNARRQLNRIISDLEKTRDAAPGQRAAAAAIAASVHRRLAAMTVADIMGIEADLRSRRTVLIGSIDAVDQLDAMAAGLDAIDVDAAVATLAAASDDTEEALAVASRRMAELDTPIAEINRANRNDQDETERLRNEAAVLRREAAELGAAEGYGAFEQAQRIDRDADGVEFELAHRELDLRYNYEPEHALAQTRANRMRERLTSIDAARRTLQERHATVAGEAGTTRAQLDEISASIDAGLAELQAVEERLTELYEAAATELDRAATKSKSSAGLADKDFADVGRIEAAQAYQGLGSLYRNWANGLDDRIRLMTRLAEVTGGSPTVIADLREARQQQLNKAAEAYKNCSSELARVSGRTARERLEALKMSMSALEVEDVVEQPLPSAAPARPDAPPARPATASTGGAESPDALMVAMLDESYPDPFDLLYFGDVTPDQAALVDSFKAAETVEIEMVAALRVRFADELAAADGTLLGSIASHELSPGTVDGNRGTINRSISGMVIPIAIVRIDGRWYVDGSAAMAETASQAAGMGQDPARFLAAVTTIMRDLTGRIGADEFSSLQEVEMAFMMALQSSLMPAPGS